MYIIIFRPTHSGPYLATDSHGFLEYFDDYFAADEYAREEGEEYQVVEINNPH